MRMQYFVHYIGTYKEPKLKMNVIALNPLQIECYLDGEATHRSCFQICQIGWQILAISYIH